MVTRKHKVLLSLLIAGSLAVAGSIALAGCGKTEETAKETVQTFADYFEDEYFENVPAMQVAKGQIEDPWKIQSDVRMVTINGAQLEEYKTYVKLLEDNGYKKYVDNGEEGIGNKRTFNTVLTKDEWTVTVVYLDKNEKATVTVAKDLPLSEHLIYKDSYGEGFIDGAKTTLHMPELAMQGDSYILQLKNGHFVVTDGGCGLMVDAEYFVEYLEGLVPEGEKPVIEAWTISHPHWDHYGAFQMIGTNVELASRLIVEEIYYCSVNAEIGQKINSMTANQEIMQGFRMFKNSEGKAPEICRPQPGQRYYFADITMDVLFTADYMPYEHWQTPDANEASTWWMYTIEGQKFLLGSDANYGNERAIMRVYDSDYFNVDIFSVLHHGINIYDTFTNFMTTKTLLYPNRVGNTKVYVGNGKGGAEAREAETYWPGVMTPSLLYGKAKEWMCYGDGGNVLTFPYTVGTAKKLAPRVLPEKLE